MKWLTKLIHLTTETQPYLGKDIWEAIPPDVKRLLYTSTARPQSFGPGVKLGIKIDIDKGTIFLEFPERLLPDDPSTIYLNQELTVPVDPKAVASPSYFPSYSALSPEQKWVYLSWLRDITSPIDIGFVFIFYYGLERQLLLGHFDEAFDMILSLRKAHANRSFQVYSILGLTYGTIWKGRADRFSDLIDSLDKDKWGNERLLICAKLGGLLTAADMAKLLSGITGINDRYLKLNRQDYTDAMGAVLEEKYGKSTFDLNNYFPVLELEKHRTILFANYTFPEDVRNPKIPNYFQDARFLRYVKELHEEAHKRTKDILHLRRMALKKRRECGQDLSTRTNFCAHCGTTQQTESGRRGQKMALIECPECKTIVSDQAIACPKCGMPRQAAMPQNIPNPITELIDTAPDILRAASKPAKNGGEKVGQVVVGANLGDIAALPRANECGRGSHNQKESRA